MIDTRLAKATVFFFNSYRLYFVKLQVLQDDRCSSEQTVRQYFD